MGGEIKSSNILRLKKKSLLRSFLEKVMETWSFSRLVRVIVILALFTGACTIPLDCAGCSVVGCVGGGCKDCDCECIDISSDGDTISARTTITLPALVADSLTRISQTEETEAERTAIAMFTELVSMILTNISKEHTSPAVAEAGDAFNECMNRRSMYEQIIHGCNENNSHKDMVRCIKRATDEQSVSDIDYCDLNYFPEFKWPREEFINCLISGERCLAGDLAPAMSLYWGKELSPAWEPTKWSWIGNREESDSKLDGLVIGYQGQSDPSLMVFKYPNSLPHELRSLLSLAAFIKPKMEDDLSMLRSYLRFENDMMYIPYKIDPVPLKGTKFDVGIKGCRDVDVTLTSGNATIRDLTAWLGKIDAVFGKSIFSEPAPDKTGTLLYERHREVANQNKLMGFRVRIDDFTASVKIKAGMRIRKQKRVCVVLPFVGRVCEPDLSDSIDETVRISGKGDIFLDFRTIGSSLSISSSEVYLDMSCSGSDLINCEDLREQVEWAVEAYLSRSPTINIRFQDRVVVKGIEFQPAIIKGVERTRFIFETKRTKPLHRLSFAAIPNNVKVMLDEQEYIVEPYLKITERIGTTEGVKILMLLEGYATVGEELGNHWLYTVPAPNLSSEQGGVFQIKVIPKVRKIPDPSDIVFVQHFPYDPPGINVPDADWLPHPDELLAELRLAWGIDISKERPRPEDVFWSIAFPRETQIETRGLNLVGQARVVGSPGIQMLASNLQSQSTMQEIDATRPIGSSAPPIPVARDERQGAILLQNEARGFLRPKRANIPAAHNPVRSSDSVESRGFLKTELPPTSTLNSGLAPNPNRIQRLPFSDVTQNEEQRQLAGLGSPFGRKNGEIGVEVPTLEFPQYDGPGVPILMIRMDSMAKDLRPIQTELEILDSEGVVMQEAQDGTKYLVFFAEAAQVGESDDIGLSTDIVGLEGQRVTREPDFLASRVQIGVDPLQRCGIIARTSQRVAGNYRPSDDLNPDNAWMKGKREAEPSEPVFVGAIELPQISVYATGKDSRRGLEVEPPWSYAFYDTVQEKSFEMGLDTTKGHVVVAYQAGAGMLPKEARVLRLEEMWLQDGAARWSVTGSTLAQVVSGGIPAVKPGGKLSISLNKLVELGALDLGSP